MYWSNRGYDLEAFYCHQILWFQKNYPNNVNLGPVSTSTLKLEILTQTLFF